MLSVSWGMLARSSADMEDLHVKFWNVHVGAPRPCAPCAGKGRLRGSTPRGAGGAGGAAALPGPSGRLQFCPGRVQV